MSKKNRTYTPRTIDKLAGAAVVWLVLNAIADAASTSLAAIDLNLMSGLSYSEPLDEFGSFPDPTGLSVWTGFGRLPQILIYFIAAFVVLKWIYRASRNAHAFTRGLTTPPPWAVGWFFVPLALLWKPYGAMSETWRVSADPDGWRGSFPPDLMRWWWGFWVASLLAGNASFRLGFMSETVGMLRIATGLEAVSGVASIGAALTLIGIIRRVSRNQTRLIAAGRTRPDAPPPQGWMDQGSDPF